MADRWLISQFAVWGADGLSVPFLECVAISQTPDPTGAYNRYSFPYSDFPDYPKISVWPDGYYVTYNMYDYTFVGGTVCALDRTSMLTGQAATQQCFGVGPSLGGLLTSGVYGATQPPAGSPNYVLALGASANQLAFWKFHVDWTTASNSTLTGPTTLATDAFSETCGGDFTCIPAYGHRLDSLGDRLMDPLVHRNFGDHEALVVNHSVTAGSGSGVRWYEIRNPKGVPTIFQQGTYAPDVNSRWMGSIGMDQSGNIGLGFSLSGPSTRPEIHYTGRLAGDPPGTMSQGEGTIIDGAGYQSFTGRWGDYSNLSVDPTDDCTFWYTNEYILDFTEAWATRIATFKFPGCGNNFSIGANPTTLRLAQGAQGSSTISTAVTAVSAGTVSLAVSGAPAGATASLNPTSVTAGAGSTLTVDTGTAAAGSYSLTVTGTEGIFTHSVTVPLTITPAVILNGGFETGTLSHWTRDGPSETVLSSGCHSGTDCARLGSTTANGNSSIQQTFTVPAGTTRISLWYQETCPDTVKDGWALVTLKDNTAGPTTTLLAKVCATTGWTNVTGSLTAGHSYTLTLTNHDGKGGGGPNYTLFDDVTTY